MVDGDDRRRQIVAVVERAGGKTGRRDPLSSGQLEQQVRFAGVAR